MDKDEIKKIILETKADPLLKSTLNIDQLLKTVENVDTDYLGNRSLSDISFEIVQSLEGIQLSKDSMLEYCDKLKEYRVIDQVFQLHKGKHVRWIRVPSRLLNSHVEYNQEKMKTATFSRGELPSPLLTNGGIVVDIKFTNSGTQILCKNKNRFVQYKFDDCITFQKLTNDEQLLLSCYDIVNSVK
jgi:hypothetical protein